MHDATINTGEPVDINRHVRKLLAKHHSIAAIWCTDDVRGIRPHLTEEQAWKVLQQVDDHHDAEWGITGRRWKSPPTIFIRNQPANRRRS